MVVPAVEERDVDGLVGEEADREQAAEPPADDDDTVPAGRGGRVHVA